MALIVYGILESPFVSKVLIALEEKGVPCEHRNLNPRPKTPELLARSPLGKIPFIEHDGVPLADSSAICAYLERLHPEPPLYPKDAREYGRTLWLEEYSDTALRDAIGPVVVERYVKPKLLHVPGDEAAAQEAIASAVPPVFDYLEGALREDAPTLLSQLSIADVAVGCALRVFARAGGEIDASRWPKLVRYFHGLRLRASFRAVVP